MDIINQDITSKKLLLIYCIDNIRDEFEKINSVIDFKSPIEKFNEVISKLSLGCFLEKRIEVDMENIKYLIQNEFIDVNFGQELNHTLEILLSRIVCIKTEIEELFLEKKQNYLRGKLDVERLLSTVKKKYLQLIDIYEQFLYAENKLAEKTIDIWNKELTDCNSYSDGEEYKFLVYATKESAEGVINIILNNNALIYTSYITDKHTKVYQNREYGLIFDINMENLLFMSDGDNQTVDFEISQNKYDFSMDNNYFFRENCIIGVQHLDHNSGRTYTPEQLLSDDYNEVDLINNRYTIPKAVFVFDNATDFGKTESQKLAKILNLRLVKLRRG